MPLTNCHPLSLLCAYPAGAFRSSGAGASFERIPDAPPQVRLVPKQPKAGREVNLRRTMGVLQQTRALESEVARHKKIEEVLRRRERALSDFLDHAPESMHRVGPHGTILWANKTELALLGHSRDEYVWQGIGDFHVDANVIADILTQLKNGEALYDYPARMRHKAGSIRHVLIHSNGQVVEGEFMSARCLMRDVTDRVRRDQELNRKLQEMTNIDRRKDEFLAMLGHELRNPLAAIMTSLELMRLRADETGMIAQWHETMARLVDDLLDVSRITRGKIELQPEWSTLDPIVERAVEIVRPLIDKRKHRLALHLTAEPVRLYGDPARLTQVLVKLLHNAAKYTPPGGHISLNAWTSGRKLKLQIADDGIGLDPASCAKVFELFVQGSESHPDGRGGVGIGLTLVRSLVEPHAAKSQRTAKEREAVASS